MNSYAEASLVGTLTSYQQITKNIDRSLGALTQRPDIMRDMEYYLGNIRSVTSIDDFLKNDRLFTFAMTAFGLKDMVYGKAFIRKVLTEGIDGQKSFALQLSDPRFREFAAVFNFKAYGKTATAFDRAQQGTVDRFLRIQLEADAGQKDEGLRLALYFQRKAPSVDSVFGLMGDAALYKVVQTALGLPSAYSSANIDKQAANIEAKLNIEDLKDPALLDKLVTRFAARWQATQGVSPQTVTQVGLGKSVLTTFDNSLLMSLQLLKRPGG
jgi:Protein of unknown function (DUF1217)